MELVMLLALIVWGPACAALGASKGLSAALCYLTGFLLGILGLLAVAVWPARKG